jgi:hypothetical protein
VAKDGKKTLTDQVGRNSTPIRPHNKDALARICEINEQCLQMLANTARHTHIPSESFLSHLFSLKNSLDPSALAAAARLPFR